MMGSRRGTTPQIIALSLQYNDQGRRVLNGITRRSHAVSDGEVFYQVWVANLFVVYANKS
jgi:hypothetical protein